jgi:hypothetical protein
MASEVSVQDWLASLLWSRGNSKYNSGEHMVEQSSSPHDGHEVGVGLEAWGKA